MRAPAFHTAYIGLGSNKGDRKHNILKAVIALGKVPGIRAGALSPLYVTSPVGPRQRDFVNAAVRIRTSLRPSELLEELQRIENEMGRPACRKTWGPRVIDLDILLYGRISLRRSRIIIPHPEMHRRRFVIEPLADIAPGLSHPLLRKTMRKLKENLRLTSPEQKVRILE